MQSYDRGSVITKLRWEGFLGGDQVGDLFAWVGHKRRCANSCDSGQWGRCHAKSRRAQGRVKSECSDPAWCSQRHASGGMEI